MSTPADRRAARRGRRTVIDGVLVAPAEATHGTYSCYSNWGCRCEPCGSAWKSYIRRRRLERTAELVEDRDGFPVVADQRVEHGSHATYTNWGCRCRPCAEAESVYKRELRARAVAS